MLFYGRTDNIMHLIALIEDSPAEAELIQEYCKRFSAENSVNIDVKWFPKGETFLRDYQPIYDLVLMDINLPALNGMDTAARLRRLDSSVALIFITSMARYAIRGYEVEAMDFLLKPVSYPMFSARIQRALRKSSQEQPQTLLINMSDGVYRIASTRIKYVEVTDHYLVYHTTEGNLNTYGKLKDVEEKLDKTQFIRCNRCYLVNLAYVRAIRGNTLVVDGDELQISRPIHDAAGWAGIHRRVLLLPDYRHAAVPCPAEAAALDAGALFPDCSRCGKLHALYGMRHVPQP